MHHLAATVSSLVAQADLAAQGDLADPEQVSRLEAACGREAGAICTWVFERSDSVLVAALAGRIIPTVLQIVLILFLAYVANRLLKRGIKVTMRRVKEEGLARLETLRGKGPMAGTGPLDIARANMRTETIGGVLRSLATFTIWAVALVMALGTLGINLGPLIAGAGIVGVALGFGAQSLVKDFLSGIFMLLEDQYGIGDIVDVGEAVGVVEAITLRTTRLRDVEGVVWHVPNGQISRVGNMSQQWARSLLDVGVAYDTDVEHAKRVMKRVADGMWQDEEWGELILDEPSVWGLQDFASDQLTMRMVIKTVPGEQWSVTREYRQRLKAAFDDEGIEIPFPQRTVWVRQEGDYSSNGDSRDGFLPPVRGEQPAQTDESTTGNEAETRK